MSMTMKKSKEIEIGQTKLEFSRLKVPAGLVIDKVLVEADSVSLDSKSGKLFLQSNATLKAEVSASDLCDFLSQTLPVKLSNMSVSIERGRIALKGLLKMVVSLQAQVECEIEIVDQQKLS